MAMCQRRISNGGGGRRGGVLALPVDDFAAVVDDLDENLEPDVWQSS